MVEGGCFRVHRARSRAVVVVDCGCRSCPFSTAFAVVVDTALVTAIADAAQGVGAVAGANASFSGAVTAVLVFISAAGAVAVAGAAMQGTTLDLTAPLVEASASGSIGILYVRVLAAEGLSSPANRDDSGYAPSVFVRARLGHRAKRTCIRVGSPNPEWDAAPFIFHVPSMDSKLAL